MSHDDRESLVKKQMQGLCSEELVICNPVIQDKQRPPLATANETDSDSK